MSDDADGILDDASSEPTAATITFSLPAGIYAFKVKSGGAGPRDQNGMTLPAVKVDVAPVKQGATVEFLSAPTTENNYLAYDDDVVVARVAGGSALFMLVSLRMPGQDALALDIARLDIPAASEDQPENLVLAFTPDWTAVDDAEVQGQIIPTNIVIDLAGGDRLAFSEGWACSLDDVQWIESFSLMPIDGTAADFLEYGAIADGQEASDWQAAGELCGIPGSNVPLMGFAVRTKPDAGAAFDCHYFGVFASGTVVGPATDGALCVSDEPGDPLVRIDLRLIAHVAEG